MSRFSVGPQPELGAPGLEVIPPVSRGASLAGQLYNALQSVGGAAVDLSHYRARQKAMDARLAQENDEVIRGEATLAYQSRFPELQKQIRGRELMMPDGMDPDEFTEQLIDAETEGTSPAYRDAYRKGLKPRVIAELVQQQADIQQEFIDSSSQRIVAGAAESGTTQSINQGVDALMRLDPLMTREKALGVVALGVGKAAATSGDTKKLESAKAAMGGLFPVEAASLDAQYMGTRRELREETRRQFNDSMSGAFIGIRDGTDTFKGARERARAWRGKVDDDAVDSALREIDAREFETQTRAKQKIDETTRKLAEDTNNDMVRSWMRNARATGGIGTMNKAIAEGRITLRPEDKRSQSEIIEQSTNFEMNRIARETADRGPQAVVEEQFLFLGNNGATYKPWTDMMNAGGFVNSLDIETARSGDFDVPKNARDGYQLWLDMGMVNPRLRDAHVTNSTARLAYDLTEKVEKVQGDRGKAMSTAFKAMTRKDSPVTAATKGQILEGSSDLLTSGHLWWGREAKNKGEIRSNVADLAEVYTAIGYGPVEAVDAAVKKLERDYRIVNGWGVNVGNKMVPNQFEEITTAVINDYAARNKVDADNLTMIPGELPNTWVMYDLETHELVDKFDTEGTFSNADLTLWWDNYNTPVEGEKTPAMLKEEVKAKQANAKTRGMVAAEFAKDVLESGGKGSKAHVVDIPYLNEFGRWLNRQTGEKP